MNFSHEEELVRRSQAGESEAFDVLIDCHYEKIFLLSYRMLGNPEEAKDATQETFIKAWGSLSRFRRSSKFSTWLHKIAVNQCLTMARRSSRRDSRHQPLEEGLHSDTADGFAPAGSALDWETRLAIRDAILRLPEKLRLVITLYYFSEYTTKEIADELSLPVNTVYSRLRLAANRLEPLLKAWGD